MIFFYVFQCSSLQLDRQPIFKIKRLKGTYVLHVSQTSITLPQLINEYIMFLYHSTQNVLVITANEKLIRPLVHMKIEKGIYLIKGDVNQISSPILRYPLMLKLY